MTVRLLVPHAILIVLRDVLLAGPSMASSSNGLLAGSVVRPPLLHTLPLLTCLTFLVHLYVYGRALGRIPGRFRAAASHFGLIIHSCRGDMHREMISLVRKHGKLVRTGPNEVSVADLAAIKTRYGTFYR